VSEAGVESPLIRPLLRPRFIPPDKVAPEAGEDNIESWIAEAGGSYRNRSSGIAMVCKSSGVIGGERSVGAEYV